MNVYIVVWEESHGAQQKKGWEIFSKENDFEAYKTASRLPQRGVKLFRLAGDVNLLEDPILVAREID